MKPSSDVVIRPWQTEDAWTVHACFVATYMDEPWNETWSLDSAEKYLAELHEMPRSTVLVAEVNGEVRGATYLRARTWQDCSEFHIGALFVHPAWQKRGIGREMVNAIRSQATAESIVNILLLTDRRMPAIEFCHKVGFSEDSWLAVMVS
ncbi:GNAT family N-acetyltransferase [Brevibacterium linens]|uniref:GNAT family N-acetyltransferase n=1 Tax=Brevibacterium linens TaxID=1703 RepID=UPI003BF46D99